MKGADNGFFCRSRAAPSLDDRRYHPPKGRNARCPAPASAGHGGLSFAGFARHPYGWCNLATSVYGFPREATGGLAVTTFGGEATARAGHFCPFRHGIVDSHRNPICFGASAAGFDAVGINRDVCPLTRSWHGRACVIACRVPRCSARSGPGYPSRGVQLRRGGAFCDTVEFNYHAACRL